MRNTLKTVGEYTRAVVARVAPFNHGANSVEDVCNYRAISEQLCTSGQPSADQFASIRDAGYTVVINLAPTSVIENSVKNEADILAELGLQYIHIPVNFNSPTEQDFDRFVDSMQASAADKVWVHCAANCRVSSFIYRYRRGVLGEDEAVARADLDAIWDPFGPWRRFTFAGE
jgi:protein tyrosine phosphatase (PTP) superfamily phosphohydrolase (DUF442 family)